MTPVRRHLLSVLFAATAFAAVTGQLNHATDPALLWSSLEAALRDFASTPRVEAKLPPGVADERRTLNSGGHSPTITTALTAAIR